MKIGSTFTIIYQIRFNPYGSQDWNDGNTAPTDYNFTAQRLDGFGLLDYHARYYDATLGRFISPDSVVPDYGNPQDLNRYSYVRGNPVRFADPSGHWLFEDTPDDEYTWFRDKELSGLVKASSPDSLTNWVETQKSILDNIPAPPFPDNGTISIGVGGNLFGATGGNFGVTFNMDMDGNFAWMAGGGGGGYAAAGGGFGLNVMVTNAPSVYDIQGTSVHVGGQIGEGVTPGIEWVGFKNKEGEIYQGVNLMGSAALFGPWPGEFHSTLERDTIMGLPNLFSGEWISFTGRFNSMFYQETTYEFNYNR